MDPFETHAGGLNAPAGKAQAIDVSGGDADFDCSRALYVGTAGDIHCRLKDGSEIIFRNVIGGFERPWRVNKIFQAGTTAADLVALY